MGVTLFVITPLIVLFFFSQRVFIEGITFTGTKG
jgi:multiple sugar transport system permease protein